MLRTSRPRAVALMGTTRMKRRIAGGLAAASLLGGVLVARTGAAFADHGQSHGRPARCPLPPGAIISYYAQEPGPVHPYGDPWGQRIQDQCTPADAGG